MCKLTRRSPNAVAHRGGTESRAFSFAIRAIPVVYSMGRGGWDPDPQGRFLLESRYPYPNTTYSKVLLYSSRISTKRPQAGSPKTREARPAHTRGQPTRVFSLPRAHAGGDVTEPVPFSEIKPSARGNGAHFVLRWLLSLAKGFTLLRHEHHAQSAVPGPATKTKGICHAHKAVRKGRSLAGTRPRPRQPYLCNAHKSKHQGAPCRRTRWSSRRRASARGPRAGRCC